MPAQTATRAPRTAREELIALERRLVGRLRREIQGLIRREAPGLHRSLAEFRRATARYERLSTREELAAEIAASDVVFVGDYHTLRQAQQTPVRLLADVLARPEFARGTRKAWLAMEMVQVRDQGHLDRYLRGEIDDAGFLRATRWERSWGFHWPSYRAILEFARRRKLPVIALNTRPPRSTHDALEARDRTAAERIAELSASHPEALVLTLFGDLHLSPGRLPRRVGESLSARGLLRRMLVVHQDVEPLYWRLASQGLEQIVDVLRLREATYCVMNATPLVMLRSYLSWLERTETSERFLPWYEDGTDDIDLVELVEDLAGALASFLGMGAPALDGITVLRVADPTRVRQAAGRAVPVEREEEARAQLLATGSHFLPETRTILFTNYSMNHAAEETARLLHALEAGILVTPPPRTTDGFFALVWSKALGYFGSKVINHKRLCYKDRDYAGFAKRARADSGIARVKEVAREVLRQREAEVSFLAGASFRPCLRPDRMDPIVRVATAQALGHMLSDRLFDAMILDYVRRDEVRSLFRTPVSSPGAPLALYLSWVKRLQYVTEFYTSRWDRL